MSKANKTQTKGMAPTAVGPGTFSDPKNAVPYAEREENKPGGKLMSSKGICIKLGDNVYKESELRAVLPTGTTVDIREQAFDGFGAPASKKRKREEEEQSVHERVTPYFAHKRRGGRSAVLPLVVVSHHERVTPYFAHKRRGGRSAVLPLVVVSHQRYKGWTCTTLDTILKTGVQSDDEDDDEDDSEQLVMCMGAEAYRTLQNVCVPPPAPWSQKKGSKKSRK
jgi:hypothetical protein